jgi:CHAT domain-containing protein/Tfp pilus assembly protein PilF
MRYLIPAVFMLIVLASGATTGPPGDTTSVHGLLAISDSFRKVRSYDTAYMYAEMALDAARTTGIQTEIGEAFYDMGRINQFRYKSEEALVLFDSSFKYLEHVHDSELFRIGIYNGYGGTYIDLGFPAKGREYLNKGYEISKKYGHIDPLGVGILNYNLGLSCIYFGEYREGIFHFMNALPIYIDHYGENGSRVASLYTNLGLCYSYLGEYEHSKHYQERSVEINIINYGHDYYTLAYPYLGLTSSLKEMGQYDSIPAIFERVLKLYNDNPTTLKRIGSYTYGAMAEFYQALEDHDKALQYPEKAVQLIIHDYHENHPLVIDLYQIIGDIYSAMGRTNEAESYYEKAVDVVIKNYGTVHPLLGSAKRKLAELNLVRGRYDDAALRVREGTEALFTGNHKNENEALLAVADPREYLRLTVLMAEIHKARSGDIDESELIKAREWYEKATGIIDLMRRGFMTEESKLFLQSNSISIYEGAIETCYRLYELTDDISYANNAFFFMEKSKGSILSEALQSLSLKSLRGIPDEILKEEENLIRQVKALEISHKEIAASDTLEKALSAQELFRARLAVDSLNRAISESYPMYHELKYRVDVADPIDVMKQLDDETIITLFEGDSAWYVYSLSGRKQYLQKTDKSSLPDTVIKKCITSLRNTSDDVLEYHLNSHRIYSALIEPSLDTHDNTGTLVIVPDGALGYFPFEAAVVTRPEADDSKPDYLLSDHNIIYTNSVTLYVRKNERDAEYEYNYLGFAPSYGTAIESGVAERDELSRLRGNTEEVNYALKLFSGAGYLDKEATEQAFRQAAGSGRIMHLAMHASVDDKNPMDSKLMFYFDDMAGDGQLHAYELYALDLGSELTILSACNTGVGEMRRGEGIMSLSRAFLYGGCPNVVMSLWKAGDKPTATIMQHFLSNLKDGLPKEEALRQAKLTYLREADPLQAHPSNWATFIMIGNNAPLSLPSNDHMMWLIGVAAVIILFLLYRRMKRKRPA